MQQDTEKSVHAMAFLVGTSCTSEVLLIAAGMWPECDCTVPTALPIASSASRTGDGFKAWHKKLAAINFMVDGCARGSGNDCFTQSTTTGKNWQKIKPHGLAALQSGVLDQVTGFCVLAFVFSV